MVFIGYGEWESKKDVRDHFEADYTQKCAAAGVDQRASVSMLSAMCRLKGCLCRLSSCGHALCWSSVNLLPCEHPRASSPRLSLAPSLPHSLPTPHPPRFIQKLRDMDIAWVLTPLLQPRDAGELVGGLLG